MSTGTFLLWEEGRIARMGRYVSKLADVGSSVLANEISSLGRWNANRDFFIVRRETDRREDGTLVSTLSNV